MKKLLVFLSVVGLVASVMGQNFVSQSFLSVKALALGTNNTRMATNLNCAWMFFQGDSTTSRGATNILGMQWTNSAGTATTNTQANIASYGTDKFNFFSDVNLWAKRDGSTWTYDKLMNTTGAGNTWLGANGSNGVPQETAYTYSSPAKLYIRVDGPTGVGTTQPTVTFTFAPVASDADCPTTVDDWVVPVTCALTNYTALVTNVPFYRFNGCKKLRLKTITSGSTYNGATTSNIWVTAVEMNGFVP